MSTAEIASDWTDPGDDFLVSQRNYDGSIMDGFTTASEKNPLFNGGQPQTGYGTITDFDRSLDQNRSNIDLNFAELKIWTAASSNEAGAYGELLSHSDLGLASLNLNETPAWAEKPLVATQLASNFTLDDGRSRVLAPPMATPSVAPSEMQIGVLDLVDAMAAFGNGLADQSDPQHSNASGDTALQTKTAAFVSHNTTSQLAQALSQFDANGNAVLGLAGQNNAVTGLTASDSTKPTDNGAGLLAVGKG